METIKASELFVNKDVLKNATFGLGKSIDLDFSNVSDIDISNVETLLDIQKIAIFNDNKILMSNLSQNVYEILSQTGLYQTMHHATNPIKVNKRLSFNS